MDKELLQFSFDRIQPRDWEYFEKFASQFLTDDFTGMQPMASPSGDKGRDAEIKGIDGKPFILFQFSVTEAWESKIKDTAKKIKRNFKEVRQYHYVTSFRIGALADELIQIVMDEFGLALQIKDCSWFIDRASNSKNKIDAAEYLIRCIALPYVKRLEVSGGLEYTRNELEIANLLLSVKSIDNFGSENLTKQVYDLLICSILSNTDAERRLLRREIEERVGSLIVNTPNTTIRDRVNAALDRLKKTRIKHRTDDDSFHIAFSEQQILAKNILEVDRLRKHVIAVISDCLDSDDPLIDPRKVDDGANAICRILEKLFKAEGETFTRILDTQAMASMDTFDAILTNIIAKEETTNARDRLLQAAKFAIRYIYTLNDKDIGRYLRFLSKNYTFQAFLQLTDDVQQVVAKINTHLSVWLDSNVILPLLVEQFEGGEKILTNVFKNLVKNGARLYVTDGIIEEAISHLRLCLICHSMRMSGKHWEGKIPYIYSKYIEAGQSPMTFPRFVERYIGKEMPEADFIGYIRRFHKITIENLVIQKKVLEGELALQLRYRWEEEHERRRKDNPSYDTGLIKRLADHDVTNFLGVIERRNTDGMEVGGFSEWFLTFDGVAWSLYNEFSRKAIWEGRKSPLISINYLLYIMSFVKHDDGQDTAPILVYDLLDSEDGIDLLDLARRVREENAGMEDHLLERRVRDAVNQARRSKFIDMFHQT